jgi:hypothetical protein
MLSDQNQRIADLAERFYAEHLQAALEAEHRDRYVAIEPDSGEHFLADSFGQAVAAARKAHPDRISFVIHIGHAAALHLGGLSN